MLKILILHGIGMEMRGKTQIEIFGPMTLPEYDAHIRQYASDLGLEVEIFHSNIENEVIRKLADAPSRGFHAAILNPGGRGSGRETEGKVAPAAAPLDNNRVERGTVAWRARCESPSTTAGSTSSSTWPMAT